jgi:uncharacterized protein (DUF488 family)
MLGPGHACEGVVVSLAERGIRYKDFPELAGRRRPKSDSINTAWHNAAFRGYADHMGTAEFSAGIEHLLNLTEATGSTAIMCAEAVWWHCHRGLIADFLKARGMEVTHIIDLQKTQPHPFTSASRIVDGVLSEAPLPAR